QSDNVRSIIMKMKKAWTASGETVAVYTSNGSGPNQFTLVNRYKQGLKEKASGFRKPFREIYDSVNGEGAYTQFLKDISEYLQESWSELLFLRKDLSSK
ncbi:MAG: hypothetical protein KGZ74_00395, partial [Chitinophagaceae bacterium]|nr:hypothetical protein [Chitinophagaceae bacterium]